MKNKNLFIIGKVIFIILIVIIQKSYSKFFFIGLKVSIVLMRGKELSYIIRTEYSSTQPPHSTPPLTPTPSPPAAAPPPFEGLLIKSDNSSF